MATYLISCRSLTYAQRAARALERNGITATIARLPRELGGTGCGYCVRVSEQKLSRAQRVLYEANLPFGKIFPEERQENRS